MKLRMNQAIALALAEEMRSDDRVVLLGEDVAEAEGPFKTSTGLLSEFGPMRVRNTPISEMGFLGAAVGAAATGLRPVVEIMFIEFLGVALDQLSTEAAKFHYLSGGTYRVPLTVRASAGAGLGFGAQHSQTLETWMFATPGLKVVSPSGPQSAYRLLKAAIRDDNPVLVIEPRRLYGKREDVIVGESDLRPLGTSHVAVNGTDVTIVALGSTVETALQAAASMTCSAEVIDLQSVVPWDKSSVLESVAQTRRLVTVEESPYTGGWGTEIVAEVVGQLHRELVAPPLRITCPDVPVPYGEELENQFVPSAHYVETLVTELVQSGERPEPWWHDLEAPT